MMLRKTTCAVGGVALACAAVYSLSLLAQPQVPSSFDLRWLYETSTKQDRLPVARSSQRDANVIVYDLQSQGVTIVTKAPVQPRQESAVRTPRSVRTIPVSPVREVPNEDAAKQKLPVGCEPAFSPVTNPAYAHISARCDS
jgi:hypothetical protein